MLKTARVFLILGLVSLVLYLGVITEFYIYEVQPEQELEVQQQLSLYRGTGSLSGRLGGGANPNINRLLKANSEEDRNQIWAKEWEVSPLDKNDSLVRSQVVVNTSLSNVTRQPSTSLTRPTLSAEKDVNAESSLHVAVRRPVPLQLHGIPIQVTMPTHKTHAQHPEMPSCRLSNCIDALSIYEQSELKQCERMAIQHVGHTLDVPTCRFITGQKTRQPVALNSQEGSGNTWLRGLLERATEICTGFYACDPEMRARGFLGEGIKSGRVLVVKTHVHRPQWIGEKRNLNLAYESSYGSAVFLIRNPAYGVIAEWNRLVTLKKVRSSKESHINVISEDEFTTDEWIKFSGKYIDKWKERTINWVFENPNHPVHVVSYEDLKVDTVGEVEKILDFLQFPYDHDELLEKLTQDFTDFQRPHMHDDFKHFNPEQKERLRTTLESMVSLAKTYGNAQQFHFYDYLQSLPDIK